MIKKILAGYKNLLTSGGKIVLLTGFCLLLSAVIVFPLYELASHRPQLYTLITLLVFGAGLCVFFFSRIRLYGFRQLLLISIRIAIIAAGIAGCGILVIYGKRLFAIPVLALTFILYGVVSFGLRIKDEQKK
jgi:hypothetical protein